MFRDNLEEFESVEGKVYGISVDSPATLQAFKETHDLGFDLISDFNRDVIVEYDVVLDEVGQLRNLARRSVFIIGTNGTITYKWDPGDPGQLPDLEEVKQELVSSRT